MDSKKAAIRRYSRIKMRQIALLKNLGENPNIRQAASQMNMSQPSASGLLKDLEEAMEVEFFERDVHGLRITPSGEVMLGWASIILANLEQASVDISALAQGAGRKIKVGISPLAAPALLPAAISRFRLSHPQATLAVQTGIEPSLVKRLQDGEIDCAIVRMAAEHSRSGLCREVLYSEGVVVVARIGHPLTQSESLTPEQLDPYEWVLPGSRGSYDYIGAALTKLGAQLPRVAVETWSTIVIINILRSSNMLSMLPKSVAENSNDRLTVVPIELHDSLYPIVLLTRERLESDTMFMALLDAIKSAAEANNLTGP